MDKAQIIERIGYFRNRAKLSQKALSIDIGMNVGYINRLECKKDFLPSVEVLLKIIEVCGTTAEEFFYSDISAYEKDKHLLDKLRTLSVKQIEVLLKYDMEFVSVINKMGVELTPEDLTKAKNYK